MLCTNVVWFVFAFELEKTFGRDKYIIWDRCCFYVVFVLGKVLKREEILIVVIYRVIKL